MKKKVLQKKRVKADFHLLYFFKYEAEGYNT